MAQIKVIISMATVMAMVMATAMAMVMVTVMAMLTARILERIKKTSNGFV